jgi:BMFP domain-containing protein YqiC
VDREERVMTDTNTWDEVRRMTDELEVKIHLAGMEARERWQALKPRLAKLEQKIIATSDRAETAITKELAAMGAALRELRDDMKKRMS